MLVVVVAVVTAPEAEVVVVILSCNVCIFFYKVANQNLQAIKGSFVFFYSHNIFSVPLAKTSHLTSACALRPLEANEMSV